MAKKSTKSEISFEEALQELETITEKLSEGDFPLEEAISIYERGIELKKICTERLKKAEERIKILVEKGGKLKEKDFDIKDD
jgi:exodeoxyribonuclease VII small subunit